MPHGILFSTNFHGDFFREFNDRNIDRVEANTHTDITLSYRAVIQA